MKERNEARRDRQPARAIRERLSYANVMATAAVFIALGGTAIATHPGGENTISTADLQNLAVTQAKIAGGAVSSGKIADEAVRTPKIRDLAITAEKLQSLAVKASKIGGKAVTTGKLADGAVTHEKLACKGNDANDEMVKVGAVCIDKYENSIWDAPTGGNQIIGNAAIDAACPDNGQPSGGASCESFYARSVAGVVPARFITWFQAQQALANSAKRLPSNAEWQMAVSGTPDSIACNVGPDGAVANTGANAGCVSRFGVFDMVGNLWEWVGDWDEQAAECENWPAGFGSDFTCIGRMDGDLNNHFPGALIRGGDFHFGGTSAGPFAVGGTNQPSFSFFNIGFRGAR